MISSSQQIKNLIIRYGYNEILNDIDWLSRSDKRVKVEIWKDKIFENKPLKIELVNGISQNRKYPNSFKMPSLDVKSKLKVGDLVKVSDELYNERFWVEILEFVSEELIIGRIDNELIMEQPYTLNHKIFLSLENIIDIAFK
jgi:hypothetical protein